MLRSNPPISIPPFLPLDPWSTAASRVGQESSSTPVGVSSGAEPLRLRSTKTGGGPKSWGYWVSALTGMEVLILASREFCLSMSFKHQVYSELKILLPIYRYEWWHLKFCFTRVSIGSEHFLVCLVCRLLLLLGFVYPNLSAIFFLVFFIAL